MSSCGWQALHAASMQVSATALSAGCSQNPLGASRRERAIRAMRVCARNAFLPEAHRDPAEAFLDSPVRLDALDFNVSAPHMHATCLVRAAPRERTIMALLRTSVAYRGPLADRVCAAAHPISAPLRLTCHGSLRLENGCPMFSWYLFFIDQIVSYPPSSCLERLDPIVWDSSSVKTLCTPHLGDL